MSTISFCAPLQGWVGPLDEVPDPVFADRMMGDGVAIDPTSGRVVAPCDGRVLSVHRARHALTLLAANGAEILIHIGLETVALEGDGFQVWVKAGQEVRLGDLLIDFDLDAISSRARSLITPVIVTNASDFDLVRPLAGASVEFGDTVMELRRKFGPEEVQGSTPAAAAAASVAEARQALQVPLAHGIHARPAARIVEALKGIDADVVLIKDDLRVSARSVVALMGLGVRYDDEIVIAATGAQAQTAVATLARLISGGMGEAHGAAAADAPSVQPAAKVIAPALAFGPPSLKGVLAAPGLAIGCAVHLNGAEPLITEDGAGEAIERARLSEALDQVREALKATAAQAAAAGDQPRSGILSAHLAVLDDPDLAQSAIADLGAGKSAEAAWRDALARQARALAATGDPRMAERAADLLDLQRRVVRALTGTAEPVCDLPPGSIVLADELLPSDLMGLDASKLAGVCTARGGPTSHVAILAAAQGVPMVVAAGPEAVSIPAGATLILDADAGALWVSPGVEALSAAQVILAERQTRRAAAVAAAHQVCRMADGTRIEVYGNVGSVGDARAAAAAGAEGSGLLRTEFLFLERQTPPDEDEQLAAYQGVADALEGRPLIVRTLDVGGDKAAPYLPIPAEENPALGVRGVRVSLWRPEMLRSQIRAILRVQPLGQCKIMVPMVAELEELRAVRAVLDQEKAALGIDTVVELGVMVETPAAAISADILAREADFLSVGTNDLTQYVLAMDRGNPELAARIDALHPAVLRMIAQTCRGAATQGRWVGVCGGLASDPLGAAILIGLGVTELSATVAAIPGVKAQVRTLTLAGCQALAHEALQQTSPQAVRALAAAHMATTSLAGA
jgi:phosphocarrier protein FPr/phosphocarrier protein